MAMNEEEEIVCAAVDLTKKTKYYCPACKERVHLKVGSIVRPHFAHYQKVACQVFSEGETAEHLTGKLQLATYLKMREKNVQLEAYLPELQQRPDILFEKEGRQIVIEFQCSPISVEKIMERTQGYLQENYEVLWILGNHFHYRDTLTAFHKACLYTSPASKEPVLLHYDGLSDCLFIRHDFQQRSSGRVSCQFKQLALNDGKTIERISEEKLKAGENSIQEINQKHQQFMRAVRYPSPKMQGFLAFIYSMQENIVSIPKELYWTLPSDWMIHTHPMHWKYQFVLWLERFPVKKIVTQKMLRKWIEQQCTTGAIRYYASPQLTESRRLQPFWEWLMFLEKRKMLKKVGSLKWSYRKPLKRYAHLEEKLIENIFK